MKITDIIDKLPCKVKLNENFYFDGTFNKGMIILIKSCTINYHNYDLCVTALNEDMDYNKSMAIKDHKKPENGKYELSYFESYKENFQPNGDFDDMLYVRDYDEDDFFDLVVDLK